MGGGCVTHRLRYPRAVDERLELKKQKSNSHFVHLRALVVPLHIARASLHTRTHTPPTCSPQPCMSTGRRGPMFGSSSVSAQGREATVKCEH